MEWGLEMAGVADKKFSEQRIVLENRARLSITGVERVEVATPTQFLCVVCGERLSIEGKNLAVDKLDVESGVVTLSGAVVSVRYLGEKKSLLSRVFR